MFGNPCGTGYPGDSNGNTDGWFLNVDGDKGGDILNTSVSCANPPGASAGSNCYLFGSLPGQPLRQLLDDTGLGGRMRRLQ